MIILTGGAGFVGSNLLKRLNAEGYDDILVVDNLQNADKYRNLVGASFRDFIDKHAFRERLARGETFGSLEAVFHQGACTDTMQYDGAYMMRQNYDDSKALLHLAVDAKVPFVYASTAAVYGHAEIATESPANECPLNVYGYSKLAFDQYVRRLTPSIDSTIVGLRYFNVYGVGEAHKGRMASMVYQFAQQIQQTGKARLFGACGPFGPGESTRDFVYVKDLVELNLFFWKKDPTRAIVNAGTGVSSSWNQMAQAVIAALGKGTIEYFDFPEGLKDKYQFNTRADLTQLRSLGYEQPLWTLNEGVRDYFMNLETAQAPFRPSLG